MRALYTAATGMTAQQLRIDNIANNLANVSTTGFKKGRGSFEDLLYENMPTGAARGQGGRPSELQVGSGTRMVGMSRDFSTGSLAQTGNTFDIALGGRGFFVVEDMDGAEFYTRDGRFSVNSEGDLVNAAGMMLSPGISIPEDASEVSIAQDGTVTATFAGSTDETVLGTIRVVDFTNAAGLEAIGGNLYIPTPASGEPNELYAEDNLQIQQGFLEGSNVDVAEELVDMIVAQRAYELTSKVVQSADETLQVVTNLKR
jgi:flagellar basal-body rod protein FlgG